MGYRKMETNVKRTRCEVGGFEQNQQENHLLTRGKKGMVSMRSPVKRENQWPVSE